MTEAPQILLAHHLKALKLPTFLREYDKVARQCAAEGVDHPRYLMRRMRRMFIRARPDLNEVNILRGFLTAIERTRGPR